MQLKVNNILNYHYVMKFIQIWDDWLEYISNLQKLVTKIVT
jgi:hypothetical protein